MVNMITSNLTILFFIAIISLSLSPFDKSCFCYADDYNDVGTDNDNNGSCEHFMGEDGTCSISSDGTIKKARGGTELMREALLSRLPEIYKTKFNFVSSRVRELEDEASTGKRHVLWFHDLPGDPEAKAAIAVRHKFVAIVFVSNWQKQQYEQHYNINFGNQAIVMPNAIEPFTQDDINNKYRSGANNKKEPIRLIYHTTPHRGLEILLPVFIKLHDEKYKGRIHLDVYSSFEVYGWKQRDQPYEPLFDLCRNHPACTYHGFQNNNIIRDALRRSHIYAYPSIWTETSCISVIEAMSAGVDVVTSSLGALPETIGQGGLIYQYSQNEQGQHTQMFMQALDHVINFYWETESVKRRRKLALTATARYAWGFPGWPEGRIEEWIRFLTTLMSRFDVEPKRSEYGSDESYSEALFVYGKRQEMRGNTIGASTTYKNALEYNPNSSLITLALGMVEINSDPSSLIPTQGIERIQSMFYVNDDDIEGKNVLLGSSSFEPKIETNSIVQYGIDARAAFWYKQMNYPYETRTALDRLRSSTYPHDDCFSEFVYATYVTHMPMSEKEASDWVADYNRKIDDLMPRLDDMLCDRVGAIPLPFPLAYYDLNFRDELGKVIDLYMKFFSHELAVTAPSLNQSRKARKARPRDSINGFNPLKVGFVSTFFTRQSSIWGNFGRTINFLQKNPLFDVQMIYYPRNPISEDDKTLSLKPQTNLYLKNFGMMSQDQNLHQARVDIVNRKYDVLVYLDMWMTDDLHKIAVAKLAPIQAYTHGHPVTSGIPNDVMDYFISWGAAEQPDRDIARSYYTEELLLLPDYPAWEYFEPRTQDGYSKIVQGNPQFSHYTRSTLADEVVPPKGESNVVANRLMKDPKSNIYFCAQAPFKLHLTFDEIIAGIQKRDPDAIVVLIDVSGGELHNLHVRITERLKMNDSIQYDRIVFIPRMPHHHLMAMYSLADVVLDSVYFGGDTTSREAFEVGSPVITLPHKTIGQRWTFAYYKMMGIDDFVAKDVNEYIDIAVRHGRSSPQHKNDTREKIIKSANEKLYRVEDGVKGWENMFLDIATRPRKWSWKDEQHLQSI